ncbi:hypothetical protein [Duganella sp. Leaf126]|uniref:hypothetical protein n=1 Tax=Duganella sp. Leaf126 TaxID=1736266 RepID=UPI0009EAE352|nr:hypothetical protein [Duganella sp. Leaf126]
MDTPHAKQAAALAALSDQDRARLQRLAALQGTDALQLWPDVWRYGFDDVEEGIRADIEADGYFMHHRGLDNAEVMSKASALVADHGKRQCQVE